MKKIISFILSMVLLSSIAVPALAEETQDEALKKVTQIVKNTLGIDNSYTEFSGNLSNERDFSHWNLYWQKDGESISVSADQNGKILSYSKDADEYYRDSSSYSPAFPKVSRDEVMPAAKAFIEKVLSKNETVNFNAPGLEASPQNVESYWLYGTINYNGLKSPETFSLKVKLDDKSVIGFNRGNAYSMYKGGIPSSTPSVAADKASELLKEKIKLQLQYVLSDDGKKAVLQYLPIYAGDYAVDANTGAIIDVYQDIYYRNEAANDMAKSGKGGYSGLSEVEQSTIDTLSGVYSKSDLDAAIRAITSLGINSAYTLDSARYTMDKATGKVQCTLNYINKISDEGTLQARFPEDYKNMKAGGG
ncbi:MAG: YcdB/YcdC domain-containing protein, partial [Oscillospiraceae bacterium]